MISHAFVTAHALDLLALAFCVLLLIWIVLIFRRLIRDHHKMTPSIQYIVFISGVLTAFAIDSLFVIDDKIMDVMRLIAIVGTVVYLWQAARWLPPKQNCPQEGK